MLFEMLLSYVLLSNSHRVVHVLATLTSSILFLGKV